MVETANSQNLTVLLPAICRQKIIDHCCRKLSGKYLQGEERNHKAYGLLAGEKAPGLITVRICRPLTRNVRAVEPHRSFMDGVMQKHAVASITPLKERGWVADPVELSEAARDFSNKNLALIGSYHMHRVAWDHDHTRDTPTILDTVLGHDSRLIMFIVSMVKPDQPQIRAFFEGSKDQEIPISIIDE